ncbi:NAD(P)-binding Rossmann-fold superfamily protein, partial [Striga hermonthica]
DPSKIEHLKALEGANERLKLFQADLLEMAYFTLHPLLCWVILSTHRWVDSTLIRIIKELIDPAVKGTLNVLSSCLKAPTVKRVVLTSSMASVMVDRKPKTSETLVDETYFSDPEFVEELKQWYILSKTLAEKAAIEFADQNGIDLLVMNPGLVMGPLLQPTLNLTTQAFIDLIREGKSMTTPSGIFLFVDVRDVAKAHVLAFENPSSNGRYCLVANVVYNSEILDVLHELYPTLDLPKSSQVDQRDIQRFQVSRAKAESLGINFISLEQSLKDTIESLKERKLIECLNCASESKI